MAADSSLPPLSIAFDAQSELDTDAHATVQDFLDYTEYLPSDLFRSLTLIRKLDEGYKSATAKVHELTALYGRLPQLAPPDRPEAKHVRRDISKFLDQALKCRQASFAEGNRLSSAVSHNHARITSIKEKLYGVPKPPSRDPTPPPVPLSPHATRNKKAEADGVPRLKLHVGGARQKNRVVVPGEVLEPGEQRGAARRSESPDSPGIDVPKSAFRTPKVQKLKTPKVQKSRASTGLGTNVHSAVAGISTSNALALLTPPPEDAKPGSKFRPWFRLTDWEMASLRKSMKKNAIWTPSDAMIRRELHRSGRGKENYDKAKTEAEEKGEPFLDEEPLDPSKTELAPGEVSRENRTGPEEAVNRGMRLNEAKKQKKEQLAREQAEAEALEAEAGAEEFVETDEKEKDESALEMVEADSMNVDETPSRPADPKKRKKDTAASSKVSLDALEADEPSRAPTEAGPVESKKPRRERSTRDRSSRNTIQIDEASRHLAEVRDQFKTLFSDDKPLAATPLTDKKKDTTKPSSRKRRREPDTAEVSPSTEAGAKENVVKKIKLSVPAPSTSKSTRKPTRSASPLKVITTTTQVPLAPAGPSSPSKQLLNQPSPSLPSPTPDSKKPITPTSAVAPTAAQTRPRRTSAVPKAAISSVELPLLPSQNAKDFTFSSEFSMRPRSRTSARGKAASAEPPPSKRELRDLRRASVNAETPGDLVTAPRSTRSGRRPAPGVIIVEDNGKNKVSMGKRRAKTGKRRGFGTAGKKEDRKEDKKMLADEVEEDIDPNEPVYCLCGDVSHGTMIACENDECEKEWFHLPCVGLEVIPPRRSKWYCPECRQKLGIDEKGNATAAETAQGRRR